MRLCALAPAKVNLCLLLGPVRETDGRHELVTLYESLSLCDELEMTLRLDAGAGDVVTCTEPIEGENLVAGALQSLRAAGWTDPPVEVSIRKRIPIAAGMAGGSADAAAALRLAAAIVPVPPQVLDEIAVQLGADVPAQLVPGISVGTGAGELVAPVEPLAPHAFVIVPQGFGLSTAAVFREADRLGLPRDRQELAVRGRQLQAGLAPGEQPPGELLVNDLERAALSLAPQLSGALDTLRNAGAETVLLCGSGPTVAGVFWGPDAEARAASVAADLAPAFPGTLPATPVTGRLWMPQALPPRR